jgi:hypothetical protein
MEGEEAASGLVLDVEQVKRLPPSGLRGFRRRVHGIGRASRLM